MPKLSISIGFFFLVFAACNEPQQTQKIATSAYHLGKPDYVLEGVLSREPFVWPANETPLTPSEQAAIVGTPGFPNYCYAQDSPILLNQFHWYDLNQDGDPSEIIFSGNCMPYPAVYLYYLKNGRYLRDTQVFGNRVLQLTRSTDKTILCIVSDACCCITMNGASVFEISTKGVQHIVNWAWHSETDLSHIKSGLWQKATSTMVLRTTPNINNKKEPSECTDEEKHGNIVAKLSPGFNYRVLHTKKSWQLIEADCFGFVQAIGQPNVAADKGRLIGWVEIRAHNQ